MAIHNEDIAVIFDELANLLEIEDANPFRVRAYRNAARSVRGLGHELSAWVAEGKDLTKIPGIGKELAAKINEILQTGTAKALTKLHKEVPASLEQILKIPGLGPKRVKVLYKELGIKTLKQLENAAHSGRLSALPGFGSKTQQHILDVIEAHREKKQRFLRATAAQYSEPLVEYLRKSPGVKDVVVAGSYRRGQDTVGDLDILVTATRGQTVMHRFTLYDEVDQVVSQGPTRCTVMLRCGLQVDLRVVEEKSFGAALHYFTGSKTHNIQVRRLGQQAGLKINEYGVFKGDKRIAGKTEDSVFKAVGLAAIPPELREGRGEIEAARVKQLPTLVEIGDIRGNLHTHTTASDGRASLTELARAAKQQGMQYLAITDHSHHLTIAHGLTAERLAAQVDEIERLNDELQGITLLKGIEVDILEDGTLDLPDNVLQRLDLVIGAVHSHFTLSSKRQTERLLRAMEHRFFSILAHPTGRLLNEREPYEVDMARVIEQARSRGCFLELNSQPQRLDLNEIYCAMAREAGVLICINSDAHSETGLENIRFGVAQARRGWLEKKDVLNTRPLNQLKRLLKTTMG
jgi:DNA polymerase (family 10)